MPGSAPGYPHALSMTWITITAIEKWHEKHKPDLREISLKIHGYSEIAFQERRSAKLLSEVLESEGFSVTQGIAGDETAFVATFAQGNGPVVSFNAVFFNELYRINNRNTMRSLRSGMLADII